MSRIGITVGTETDRPSRVNDWTDGSEVTLTRQSQASFKAACGSIVARTKSELEANNTYVKAKEKLQEELGGQFATEIINTYLTYRFRAADSSVVPRTDSEEEAAEAA